MNSILQTLSALLAGALLNLGLERFAEWLDPVSVASDGLLVSEREATLPCIATFVPAEPSIAI